MTTYEQSKVQLVVNKMDNDCWEHLSSKSNEEIYIVGSNPSGVVKIDLDAVTMVQAEVQTMASAIDLTNSHVSALESRMGEVSASVSTLTSQVSSMSSQVSANTSAIANNTSAISSLTSSISAVAGSLNVSGIGCSTVVMSGTYSDSTSFAFNVVVQPSA